MKITAILCTYNRCQELAKALESLAASVLPVQDEWEILVVDNNSRDQTRSVTEEFIRRYPGHFQYLFEPQQGKSRALNAGVRHASGDVLAFVDDDVTVDANWLRNLTENLRDGQWAGAGGRILIPIGFTPPPWLALDGPWRQSHALCAHFDFGETAGDLKEAPYGTNMAFRKEAFERYGGFRVDLGPRPGSELRNEDTEFGTRLLMGGERLLYVPSAVVYHPVPGERVKKGFFRARWFAYGRAEIREKGKRQKLSELPRYYAKSSRTLARQILTWMRSTDPHEKFGRQCAAWRTVGNMIEVLSLAVRNQPVEAGDSVPQGRASL